MPLRKRMLGPTTVIPPVPPGCDCGIAALSRRVEPEVVHGEGAGGVGAESDGEVGCAGGEGGGGPGGLGPVGAGGEFGGVRPEGPAAGAGAVVGEEVGAGGALVPGAEGVAVAGVGAGCAVAVVLGVDEFAVAVGVVADVEGFGEVAAVCVVAACPGEGVGAVAAEQPAGGGAAGGALQRRVLQQVHVGDRDGDCARRRRVAGRVHCT